MTTDKARKRAVRSRMQKTGERYAAARRHVVAATTAEPADGAVDAMPPRVADPGVSDETVRNATGRDWDEWLRELDAWGATGHTHRDIARHVYETYGIGGWWAQSVTVGYERARGMRAVHETSRGFEVSVSRTLDASVTAVRAALTDARRRGRWVEPGALRLRSTTPRQVRFDVASDSSTAVVVVDPKGDDRSVATVTNSGLADADVVAERRGVWRTRLSALAASLATERATATSGVASRKRRAS
jgi:hypothetical protein